MLFRSFTDPNITYPGATNTVYSPILYNNFTGFTALSKGVWMVSGVFTVVSDLNYATSISASWTTVTGGTSYGATIGSYIAGGVYSYTSTPNVLGVNLSTFAFVVNSNTTSIIPNLKLLYNSSYPPTSYKFQMTVTKIA